MSDFRLTIMSITKGKSTVEKRLSGSKETIIISRKVIGPVNFIHVCFQPASVNLLTYEIFLDFDWQGWAR